MTDELIQEWWIVAKDQGKALGPLSEADARRLIAETSLPNVKLCTRYVTEMQEVES